MVKEKLCRDWFGKYAKIKDPDLQSIYKFSKVILELSHEKVTRIISFLKKIYEWLISYHTSADFYFALGDLCCAEKSYSESLK
jgi:hypothetical protein